MKAKQKNNTVVNAVLFLFMMSMTFVLGWFLMTHTSTELSSDVSRSREFVANSPDEDLSAIDEEWEWIQQWIADNEVQTNAKRIPENIDHLEIIQTYEEVSKIDDSGVVFGGFVGEYDDLTVSWELETPQDRLNFRVSNRTSDYYPLIIKVFYNYEAVDFRVAGEDTYRNELLINLPPGYEYIIPFHLDPTLEAHDGYSKLTLATFFDPDEYSVFHGWGYDLEAIALNFELNYGSDEPPALDKVQHPFEERTDVSEDVPLITVGQLGSIIEEIAIGPGRPRQVSPGEEIEMELLLNVRGAVLDPDTGERSEVEDFLIIGLLDFNQIELSGRPFLWSATGDAPLFGHVTIEAPMESGLYDFIALIVENPTSGMTLDNFEPIEMSMRFTIEVIEE